ncbi:hypothetical protein [uncultured Kriegella sp.]|uniref:hypothetical protein n=1 Tax=uncultured Kriegella sp. TaxID=1798910 RepID=UPI0030DD8374|tara:strand:- start:87282 stop:88700 length:1419 start_codon:yes stop_codon:yes gene_type:complete
MKTRAERLKIQNKLSALLEEAKVEVGHLPNVVDVAIGLKETSGELTEEIVFQIFVKEKLGDSDLKASEVIPKTIKGHKTDVVIVPKAKKRDDTSEHRPIKGGIQISNGKGHVGTLGCFGRLKSDNSLVLLSNEHVLYSDGAVAGEKIGQPNVVKNCCCCCAYVEGEIGTILSPSFNNSTVDCAIASIDAGIATDIILNNSMTTTEIEMDGTDTAVVGDLVRKIGRTSGFTNGIVNSINGVTSSMTGQIFIRPVASETFTEGTNGKRAFSDGGDSGSIIVDESNNIIGLLWGGDPNSFTVDETYACHINDVLNAFRNGGSEIDLVFTPADRTKTALRESFKPRKLNIDLRDQLLESERGKELVFLFEMHQKEVLQLINTNREVKVTWHRNQGPAYVAHIANSYKDKNYRIPTQVKSIALQELLIKMTRILKENGSIGLQQAIEQQALDIIHDSYGIDRLQTFIDKMKMAAVFD